MLSRIKSEKLFLTLAGFLIAVAFLFSSNRKLPVVDTAAEAYFQQSITKAGIAYAACRGLNASVSIIKESNLHLEPAGVGVSLAVGQALDPLDDMTERLSDVLVTAITSLGVQKLLYEMGQFLVPPVAAIFILLLCVLIWVENKRAASVKKIIIGVILLLGAFRFCLPLSSLVNQFLYNHYFNVQIMQAQERLTVGVLGLEKLKDVDLPDVDGVLGTIENSTAFLKEKTSVFKEAVAQLAGNMAGITESLLTLTFLYVGLFIIQVIILPLVFFWFLYKLAATLLN